MLMACLLAGSRSFAQTDSTKGKMDSLVTFSGKLGVNMQSMSSKAWKKGFTPGIVGGVNVGWHKKKIGIAAEILVSTASFKSDGYLHVDSASTELTTVNAIYINIPVFFEYQFIPALKLQVGPQYTNMISAKGMSFEGGDPKALFKGSEFSVVGGLEARFLKKVLAGARYVAGLSDVNAIPFPLTTNDPWKNSAIQVYVGYSFR